MVRIKSTPRRSVDAGTISYYPLVIPKELHNKNIDIRTDDVQDAAHLEGNKSPVRRDALLDIHTDDVQDAAQLEGDKRPVIRDAPKMHQDQGLKACVNKARFDRSIRFKIIKLA
jgi:hypothetical protein